MDGRLDVIERLGAAGIGFFVTGSEAMAVLGIAYRATNDIDLVLDLDPAAYETGCDQPSSPAGRCLPAPTCRGVGRDGRA